MIVVRNVFQLKFGQAREALAAFKEISTIAMAAGQNRESFRILTDVVAPFYTLVLELTYESLAAYEQSSAALMQKSDWRNAYQKFTPHVESGYREIFTVAS